jgi:hypothetical protein
MAKPDHGGPAFPEMSGLLGFRNQHGDMDYDITGAPGMSLRDYFAAQALAGLTANGALAGRITDLSQYAYKMADAMLRERAKGETQ